MPLGDTVGFPADAGLALPTAADAGLLLLFLCCMLLLAVTPGLAGGLALLAADRDDFFGPEVAAVPGLPARQ